MLTLLAQSSGLEASVGYFDGSRSRRRTYVGAQGTHNLLTNEGINMQCVKTKKFKIEN